ncbi:glycosyltransferase family 4 protein [Planktothrix sp. FACHB-1365]|uniref:glycosyltransferase family 4 protein n=1 Tax=Planktothrix sp. FACHB-1365 TaxID=2692855 RepID=UPI001686F37B|nr:glycosyltransferase family 4 protein [Planktothrix sp. FACHB-1365]MBD2484802.1 glycosyltransferase family 4 protein [Planktothrix sp. FACHB-1365]
MHIAWLGKKSPFCGNVTYSREITNALLDRGHRVSFLHFAQEATNDRTPEWQLENGSWKISTGDKNSKVTPFPMTQEVSLPCLYKSQVYTIPTLSSSKVLTESLQRLKPDLVHASLTLSPLDFVLPEICAELNIPLVATFHTPFDHKLRNIKSGTQHLTYQIYAPFLANYDRVIVFSQVQREMLNRLGVPKHRVAVIPNGVDVEKYSPGPSRFKEELGADRVFVYQGRLATEKNVESLLKAWKKSEMGPGCLLVIVGDGPMEASLQASYNGEEGIIWFGFVGDEDRRIEILRGADVFVLPSMVEGLSISLLEAMSCGTACVATDAGADGEVMEGGAGIIMKTQGVTSQLRTLLPLLRDHPEMIPIVGQKARQRVLERYTLSQNITQLEHLYRDLVQEQRLEFSHVV